nr:hypothetical protein Q903MT_gene6207 [Picea sitchensis]
MILPPLHAPNFQLVLRLVHPPGKIERFVFNCFKAIAIRSLKILQSKIATGQHSTFSQSGFIPFESYPAGVLPVRLGCLWIYPFYILIYDRGDLWGLELVNSLLISWP